MAWWNEIREMVRQELGAGATAPATDAAPTSLHQAQQLLQRTAQELADARTRAEAVARRLQKAQQQLEALTRQPQSHPRYRERLVELARSIARDSDLAGSFRTHLGQLDLLQDQVRRQLRELDHDLSMARAVSAIGRATQARAARSAQAKPAPRRRAAAPAAAKTAQKKPARNTTAPTAAAKKTVTRKGAAAPPAAVPAGFRRSRASRVIDALKTVPAARRPGRRRED